VFVGVVRSNKPRGNVVEAQLLIEKSWKGSPAGRTVVVATMPNGASCGVELKLGSHVLVFAHPGSGDVKGNLWTDLCEMSTWWPTSIATLSDSLGPPESVAMAPRK